jgi:Putative prokaryotic signal transducing protein
VQDSGARRAHRPGIDRIEGCATVAIFGWPQLPRPFLDIDEDIVMKTVRTYATTVDANIAKIALDAAGVPSLIVGVGAAMEGGAEGVRLLVPEERVASALRVLEDLGRTKSGAPP